MNEQIQGLKDRIEQLVSRYEALCAKDKEAAAKLAEYEKLIEQKDITINQLKERLDNLQMTLALGSASPDRTEAKRKVAGLIKEIDKCMALLND